MSSLSIPQIQNCKSLSDLPALRAGGIVYIIRDGPDAGLGTYFAAKGFQIEDWVVTPASLSDYCGVSVRVMPEATRLVVAVGGQSAMQVAKTAAHYADKPLWCVPTNRGATGALWCYVPWVVQGTPRFIATPPHTVMVVQGIMQDERIGIQQAYQCLMACYVALVCDVYQARMLGQEQENATRLQCAEAVHDVLMGCGEYSPALGVTIWQALATAAQQTSLQEIALFALMICLYKGQDLEYNKYMCAAALAVGTAIAEWPDVPDLYLPPDGQKVREGVVQLGVRALAEPAQTVQYARIDWAWRDYLADAGVALKDMDGMAKTWRRLVGAAGYGYFDSLLPQDLPALLPLAAALSPTYTPLKHLYMRGGLNGFI